MDLSIIIVNFNTKDLLRQCLESLTRADLWNELHPSGETRASAEVIVVDNASADGSTEMVGHLFPQIKLIVNRKNLGFAKANNLGIKRSQGRFILLLNPDTVVPKETLSEMMKFMKAHPKVGAATCYVELASGGLDPACHRGFPTPWASFTYFTGLERLFPRSRTFGQYHQTWKNLSEAHEIDSPVGSFFLVRREVIDKIGPLDERFFMYAEDLDWAKRIWEAGFKIMFYPHVKIIHHKGVASGMKEETQKITTATQETRQRTLRAFFDTMWLFYEKHYRDKCPRFVTALVFLGIWLMKQVRLFRARL